MREEEAGNRRLSEPRERENACIAVDACESQVSVRGLSMGVWKAAKLPGCVVEEVQHQLIHLHGDL